MPASVAKVVLTLQVNGEERHVVAAAHRTLLEVLREDLNLTGTKHGCELGECGTCTVLVDGQPVLSCLALPVECQGRRITTVEGMAEGGRLHPLQQAFAELGAAQCGYCTPGILLTAQALLVERPMPDPGRGPSRRWPAISAGAPATPRSSTPSSWPRSGCAARPRERGPAGGAKPWPSSPYRPVAAQDRRVGQGHRRHQVRGRPGAAAPGPRQAPAEPASPRAHRPDRHRASPGRCPACSPSSPGTTCPG